MCGRYFWNDDAEDEFLEDFPDLTGAVRRLRAGDYTPGMSAPALAAGTGSGVCMEPLLWGFPGFDKGRLLINARAESVKDQGDLHPSGPADPVSGGDLPPLRR